MTQERKDRAIKDRHSNCPKWLPPTSDVVKGVGPGQRFGTGGRYEIRAEPGSHSTAMLVDKSVGRSKQGAPVGEAVLRFDHAHKGANYPHININSKISGRPDPHYKVPSAVVEAAPTVGKVLKSANKAAVPVAVAMDVYRVAKACKADRDAGDKDYPRTKTEVSGAAGGWTGALAGGLAGAALGSRIMPGIGTIVGAAAGAIAGGIGGDAAGQAAGRAIFAGNEQEDCEANPDKD